MTEEQLRTIWKNPEIQKYIQQNNQYEIKCITRKTGAGCFPV